MKTALVLGGGGARGAYQIGVWQALRELGIEIDMVMGTSVGAINSAAIAQGNFDEAVALWKNLEARSIPDIKLDDVLREHIDEELVRKSPLDFGIVTLEIPKMSPRYLFHDDIPQGKLIEFLQASSAFFPIIKDIDRVKYVDGGYYDNLPVNMALDRGADRIIAVDLDSIGIIKRAPKDVSADIRNIDCCWPLGNITIFDKNNSTRIMRLGYLDAMKSYGVFDGNAYTFIRSTLDRRLLNGAENAGKIFELDPLLIYSHEMYHKKLKAAFTSHATFMESEISAALGQLRQHPGGGLARLVKQLNGKSLTIVLCQLISDHILIRTASRLFPSEMAAAGYLHRCFKTPDTAVAADPNNKGDMKT